MSTIAFRSACSREQYTREVSSDANRRHQTGLQEEIAYVFSSRANLESQWTTLTGAQLEHLENVLRFFHAACKDHTENVACLTPQSRITCWGNIECAVAEACFGACITNKNKVAIDIVRKDMLTAVAEHLGDITVDKSINPPHPGEGSEWICPIFW